MINLIPALDQTTRNQVYAVRHEVYCEEQRFEPLRADRRELDKYDRHSLHCLARIANDRTPVGCIRLVLPCPEAPEEPLPFESICQLRLDRSSAQLGRRRRHRIAEISRFAIRREYRRRASERYNILFNGKRPKGFPRCSDIPTALYLGSIALAESQGIDTLFFLSEPHLPRFFSRLGSAITPIGNPVQHHGLRIPSSLDVRHFLASMNPAFSPIWQAIRNEIRSHMPISAHGWHERLAAA